MEKYKFELKIHKEMMDNIPIEAIERRAIMDLISKLPLHKLKALVNLRIIDSSDEEYFETIEDKYMQNLILVKCDIEL